jgi:hypothetical protein
MGAVAVWRGAAPIAFKPKRERSFLWEQCAMLLAKLFIFLL